jgi:hypothetical protein
MLVIPCFQILMPNDDQLLHATTFHVLAKKAQTLLKKYT